MNIPEDPSLSYIIILLFLVGLFLFISGLNIIKIEKITISQGFKTWFIGLVLMIVSTLIGTAKITNFSIFGNKASNTTIIKSEGKKISNNDIARTFSPSEIFLWAKAVSVKAGFSDQNEELKSYEISKNYTEKLSLEDSVYIKKNNTRNEKFYLYKTVKAESFQGQYVEFSAFIKGMNSSGGIYFQAVKDEKTARQADDNCIAVNDTDWKKCKIIIYLPKKLDRIIFGFNLSDGEVWLDSAKLLVLKEKTKERGVLARFTSSL